MTWNDRFVWFWWKGYCFPVFARSSGQCDDFENFDAQKCHLEKRARHELKRASLQFSWESALFFLFSREFQASVTILRNLTLKNAIWPKRAPHDLKKSVLNNFNEKRTVFPFLKEFQASWRFWEILRSKLRFGQNVLRMTWKKRFVQFSWKGHCFPFSEENLRRGSPFWELWRSKMRFGQNVLRLTWKERFAEFL